MEKGEKETRKLKFKLTDKEILARAQTLIEADEEIEQIAKDKTEENEKFKELKDDATERKKTAREAVKTGEEDRDVECEWEADYTSKQWLLKRKDTGKVVESQTMSKEDLALDLGEDITRDKTNGKGKGKGKGKGGAKTPKK